MVKRPVRSFILPQRNTMIYLEIEPELISEDWRESCIFIPYTLRLNPPEWMGESSAWPSFGGVQPIEVRLPTALSKDVDEWFTRSVVLCVGDELFRPRHFVLIDEHPLLIVDRFDDEYGCQSCIDEVFPFFGEDLLQLRRQIERVYHSREIIAAQQDEARQMEWKRRERELQLDDKGIERARAELLRKHGLDDESVVERRHQIRVPHSHKRFIVPL